MKRTSVERCVVAARSLVMAYFAFSVVSGLSYGGAYASNRPQSQSSYGVYEVARAPKDLPISRTPPERIEVRRMAELRGMLERRQFEPLTLALEAYQSDFEKDHSNEYRVYDAFRSFYVTLPSYEVLLNEWVAHSPERYPPYLASANYYHAQAWESRGTRFRKDTPEENFKGMRFYLEKAAEAAVSALELNPQAFTAYNTLLGIYNMVGMSEEGEQVYYQALARFPHSFLIRSTYMWSMEPRWGGSYEAMEWIAKEAEKYAKENPKLSVLYGFIYYDQARGFEKQARYERAIELYTRALGFGDHWAFYDQRASVYYYDLKRYDQALKDIDRSIRLRPTIADPYRLRARIMLRQGNAKKSVEDIRTAELLEPNDPKTRKWKEYAVRTLLYEAQQASIARNPEKAIEKYSLAIEFDADNPEIHVSRGFAYYRLDKLGPALADFEKAILLDPQDIKAYGMVDRVLSREKRWDEVVKSWSRYIRLKPDDHNGYVFRGLAHAQNRDAENAQRDFERSCELGNPEGCDRSMTIPPGGVHAAPEAR